MTLTLLCPPPCSTEHPSVPQSSSRTHILLFTIAQSAGQSWQMWASTEFEGKAHRSHSEKTQSQLGGGGTKEQVPICHPETGPQSGQLLALLPLLVVDQTQSVRIVSLESHSQHRHVSCSSYKTIERGVVGEHISYGSKTWEVVVLGSCSKSDS